MAKPSFKLKCRHCHKRLADFFKKKDAADVTVETKGDFHMDTSQVDSRGIVIAVCHRCGGATEFEAKHLPGPESSSHFH